LFGIGRLEQLLHRYDDEPKTNGCNKLKRGRYWANIKGFGSGDQKEANQEPTKKMCCAVITHPIHWVNLL